MASGAEHDTDENDAQEKLQSPMQGHHGTYEESEADESDERRQSDESDDDTQNKLKSRIRGHDSTDEGNQSDHTDWSKKSESSSSVPEISRRLTADYPKSTKRRRSKLSRRALRSSEETAAEKALNSVYKLHDPPEVRNEGNFTEDEIEIIRKAIQDYQEANQLTISELCDIIHSSPHVTPAARIDFWSNIKIPNSTRKEGTIRTHVRGRYHAFKTGAWTSEEKERFDSLVVEYGSQWTLIAKELGRLPDLVKQYARRQISQQNAQKHKAVATPRRETVGTHERNQNKTSRGSIESGTQSLETDVRRESTPPQLSEETSQYRQSEEFSHMPTNEDLFPRSAREQSVQTSTSEERFHTPMAEDPFDGQTNEEFLQTPMSEERFHKPMRKKEPTVAAETIRNVEKEHRKSKKSMAVPVQPPRVEEKTTATPEPMTDSRPRIAQMLWGDKYDLVKKLMRQPASPDQINWEDVAASFKRSWPVETLQVALRKLIREVKAREMADDETSHMTLLKEVKRYLSVEHGDQLDEHYQFDAQVERRKVGLGSVKNKKKRKRDREGTESHGNSVRHPQVIIPKKQRRS